MQGYNIIIIFNKNEDKILMCKRTKDPYKGLLNFPGGKIEKSETGIDAAYRELKEETSISVKDVFLTHLMDFTYYMQDIYLEVYVGKLDEEIEVFGTENKLVWESIHNNFFNYNKYAGEGNIGHIMLNIEMYKKHLLI